MRLRVGIVCYVLLYVVVLLLPAIVASQPTECHIYDAQQPVREGWGAAYDVFSAEQEVLLKAICAPDETLITVGNNNADTYIYHLGGQWINKKPEQIVLQCSGEKLGGAWCVGEATGVISAQSPYFAAYICRWINGSWKCGCRDKQCAQPFWQLQKVGMPPAAPSNVQAEEITHEGRLSTEVSWTDNADNELGFVVVDQNRPQEYEADQVPGVGSTGSLILPFVSSFCVYAYNDYGRSDAVCPGEVAEFMFLDLPVAFANIDYINWYGNTEFAYKNKATIYKELQGLHSGIDFIAPNGTPIKSVVNRSGKVVSINNQPPVARAGPGSVLIDYGDYLVLYGHTQQNNLPEKIKLGETINSNDTIAYVGPDTAGLVHLHLEVIRKEPPGRIRTNPVPFFSSTALEQLKQKARGEGASFHSLPSGKWQTPEDQPDITPGGPLLVP